MLDQDRGKSVKAAAFPSTVYFDQFRRNSRFSIISFGDRMRCSFFWAVLKSVYVEKLQWKNFF